MSKRILILVIVSTLSTGFVRSGYAQDLTGTEVLENVEDAIDASSAEIALTMELYNAAGDKRERSMTIYTEESDNTNRSFMKFTAPADVEGTAFLSLEQSNGVEEMYLYMPVLGNIRRIAGSQKNGSFVGTDFTYNDMTILGGGNYKEDYQSEVLESSETEYVLKLTPTDEEIEYSYTKMWVPTDKWFPTRIEFYGSDTQLQKVLSNEEYEEIEGYWTARKITMENVRDETRTVLQLTEVQYDIDIPDNIFTTRYLQRQ